MSRYIHNTHLVEAVEWSAGTPAHDAADFTNPFQLPSFLSTVHSFLVFGSRLAIRIHTRAASK